LRYDRSMQVPGDIAAGHPTRAPGERPAPPFLSVEPTPVRTNINIFFL
jgi:hypothetical protein